MVKKWIGANEIVDKEVDREAGEEFKRYKKIMQEKPNWNKREGAKKIFQRKEYSIYRASDGFIIHNTNLPFKGHHTHIRGFHKAKSLVDLCIRKKLPNTPKKWEIQSLLRISNNQTYKNKLLVSYGETYKIESILNNIMSVSTLVALSIFPITTGSLIFSSSLKKSIGFLPFTTKLLSKR